MFRSLRFPTALMLAVTLFFNNVALASDKRDISKDINEVRKRMEQIDTKTASLQELQTGMKELRIKLAQFRDDLDAAEMKHDKRFAVKLRNYGGLGYLGLMALMIGSEIAFCKGPDCYASGVVALFTAPFAIAFVLGTQGYIYVTEGELRKLRNVVEELREKIDRIEGKIELRRSQLQ